MSAVSHKDRPRFPPGKIRTLSALQGGGQKYGGIKTRAVLQDPSLIKYLGELVAEGLIKKDTETRLYSITDKGRNELAKIDVLDSLRRKWIDKGWGQRVIAFATPDLLRDPSDDAKALSQEIEHLVEALRKKELLTLDVTLPRRTKVKVAMDEDRPGGRDPS